MFNQYAVIFGEPGQASKREEGVRTGFHRLAGIARWPEGYWKLPNSMANSYFIQTPKTRTLKLVRRCCIPSAMPEKRTLAM